MAEAGQQQTLAHSLRRYQPRRTQRYEGVYVLLLRWAEDDIGPHLAREVDELHRLFGDVFKYAVSEYKIPSIDPGTALNSYVANYIETFGGDDNLIIVFYSGHGGPQVSTKSPCTWSA
jgi:hypothetical protein